MSDSPQTDGTPPERERPPARPITDRFDVRATADGHFAWLRTRLALKNTPMSWVSMAVSLIGFGFTIVQFFDRMQQMPEISPARFPDAPRYMGLALIFCGILGLVISVWEYRRALRYLWDDNFSPIAGMTKGGMQTPTVAIAILLIVIGAAADRVTT